MRRTNTVLVFSLLACGPAIDTPSEGETGGSPTATEGPMTGVPGTSGTSGPGSTSGPTTSPPMQTTSGAESGSTCFPSCDASSGDVFDDCSLWEQDCPEGEKCMPWANDGGNEWNDTRCVPLAEDPEAPGEPCMVDGNGVSGIDNCDGTSMCWNVDPETNAGICHPFCLGDESDPSCPHVCDFCTISGSSIVTICLPTCDPVGQNCDKGSGCYYVSSYDDAFLCIPDASGSGGAPGDACESLNACDPGSLCLDAAYVAGCESLGCCTPLCTVGDSTPCAVLPGTECIALFEDEPPSCQSSNLGACTVPP